MQRAGRFLAGALLVLVAAHVDHSCGSRRRVCSREAERRAVSYLTSHLQPVYQPYLTLCQGSYRLCSTYRTTYRVVERQAYRKVPQPAPTCCPGWRRASGLGCTMAVCQRPCQNGGWCDFPNRCACPSGWTGRCCETDVDECAGGGHGCRQVCLNGAGSFRCACWPGYALQADGRTCRALARPTGPPATAPGPAGTSEPKVQHEVGELKRRVAVLEDRVQRALAPFLKLELAGPEVGQLLSDPLGLLLHALRQLDRIESLSEQISFLEERLETCSCKNGR